MSTPLVEKGICARGRLRKSKWAGLLTQHACATCRKTVASNTPFRSTGPQTGWPTATLGVSSYDRHTGQGRPMGDQIRHSLCVVRASLPDRYVIVKQAWGRGCGYVMVGRRARERAPWWRFAPGARLRGRIRTRRRRRARERAPWWRFAPGARLSLHAPQRQRAGSAVQAPTAPSRRTAGLPNPSRLDHEDREMFGPRTARNSAKSAKARASGGAAASRIAHARWRSEACSDTRPRTWRLSNLGVEGAQAPRAGGC